MSEFKGTKGKWFCYRKTESHKIEEIRTETGQLICTIPFFIEESEANAQLMSCAPEMLEMLEDIKDYLGSDKRLLAEQLIKKATEL